MLAHVKVWIAIKKNYYKTDHHLYQDRFHTLIKLHDKIKHLISCVKNKNLLKSFSFKNKINYINIQQKIYCYW